MDDKGVRQPRIGSWFPVGSLLVLLLGSLPLAGQMDEYSIKAAYLYNFSRYVEWPGGGPITICVAGDDPFGGKLEQAVAGKTAGNGQPIEVKRVSASAGAGLKSCRILFLAKSEKAHAGAVVNAVKDAAVFTVADFAPFAENGGVANLTLEGSRVRVALNMGAANHANLKISGKLQQVAVLVGGN